MAAQRVRFIVRGQVQGVGFRPFVFTLAEAAGLTGFVRNSPRGVVIEAQGPPDALRAFAHGLEHRLPPLARVTASEREDIPAVAGEQAFVIGQSTAGSAHAVLISPDTCTCADCLADMRQGRRLRYPFTNCTNCGPRYTITCSIPYDRVRTSMACFPLCPDCLAEYQNPRDRRFHAQPNACPLCGPQVWFVKQGGGGAGGTAFKAGGAGGGRGAPVGDAALRAVAEHVLVDGGIAAIKGLGGFHLACDACDAAAVTRLRERKNRPHKPFAVMAASLEEARRFACIGPEEEALLLSPEHPIVLCPLSDAGRGALAPGISPDTACVGVMLPYTPLHVVLFEHVLAGIAAGGGARPAVLVMTSGNPGGEPICLGNREALKHLGGMAEAFLFHNRDIVIRVDDSVVRPLPGRGALFFRRARGYVPRPIALDPPSDSPPGGEEEKSGKGAGPPCVLGAGAELKNTLCLTKGDDAFVGQHIGDMANVETAAFHEEIRDHLAALLRVSPGAVVRDLHPDYLSSRMAEAFAQERGLPLYALQHHVAHAHAVLAEHRFRGRALALALDGTGLGEDGALWGGELLYVDTGAQGAAPAHKRLGHLAPMDLPGGEAAIREPWRIAHALLLRLGLISTGSRAPDRPHDLPWLPAYAQTAAFLPVMLERRLNTPVSTSCGRLFDAVSAMLGLCSAVSYEGQAAIRLEEAQSGGSGAEETGLYPCGFAPSPDTGCLQLDSHALFAALFADRARGGALPVLARRFHQSLAAALAALAAAEGSRLGIRHVGLSGGCLQNRTLALELARRLEGHGLVPLLHKDLPPGDGCISLGQAAWGRHMARCGALERGAPPLEGR